MKILITGVHGFVGSNLVEALKKEHTIYGMDIVAPVKEGVVETFGWDDIDKVKDSWLMVNGSPVEIDAIIHLAGKAHDVKSGGKGQEEEYMKINCGLTQKIYDFFLNSSAKKFVFFSTAKAAADKVEGVLTEDVIPHPVGSYGESKIAAEKYILSHTNNTDIDYSNTNLTNETNKQVYILRPCMIHGPGNKGNLNLLYNVVKKGIPWPLGAFENKRTFTSIDNICFAINGILTKDVPSGIYNMGDDEALSTNELIEEICKSLGKKTHIWELPKGLMGGIAKMGDVLHLPLNSERLRKLTEDYVSSNEKIKKALGVEKMPVDAREGLKVTLESFTNPAHLYERRKS